MGDARELLKALRVKRVLVVADPYFREGVAQRLGEAAGEQAEYFFDVEPDPTVELAAKGASVVKKFAPELVVALGGGSAMDLAKSMVWFSGVPARLAAIPTTSGSGSEVTDFAILTHGGIKHPLVDPALRPHMAILDTALVEKLPRALVADGGFDALTHALEAYTATGANAFSDALAQSAFSTVLNRLERSYGGCGDARGQVHYAATMAGLAFNQAGLGLCHAMSHALGGQFHLPHGRLNAILLPGVMEVNGCHSRYARLARQAGLEGRSDTMAVRSLRNTLLGLRKRLGLPATLAEAGVTRQSLSVCRDGLLKAVLEDPCCKTNPIPVTVETVSRVLKLVSGHG